MPESNRTFQFAADRGDAGRRLDHILVRRLTALPRFSRTRAQAWIAEGAVVVDGRAVQRPSARVPEGATIHVRVPADVPLKQPPAREPGHLDVLFEDEGMLVVNKPAGLVVHPSYKRSSGTLLNAVLWRLRDRDGATPGILTRLDQGTSGVVVIALSPAVHAALQRDASAGAVRKEYLAVVRGWPRPARGDLRGPLGPDPADRRRTIVRPDGAPSHTRYETVDRYDAPPGRTALVRCELVTGRTHQIRVHLAAAGWPVLGDRTYGGEDSRINRQALHAWRVTLRHPVTREPIAIEAPLPEDIRGLLAARAC